MENAPSVYQMNADLRNDHASKTIQRIDDARPPYDRHIHAHFTDGSALYINGEWKHGYKVLTRDEKKFLKKYGWKIDWNLFIFTAFTIAFLRCCIDLRSITTKN